MKAPEKRRENREKHNTSTECGGMGSKGSSMTSSSSHTTNRKRRYGMMLLLAFGAAVLSLLLLHKLRERHVYGILLHDRDHQLVALQLILEKERENSNKMKKKIEEMRAKVFTLRNQKMELKNKLMNSQTLVAYLKHKQQEMESTMEEKQNKINTLNEMETESIKANVRVAALTKLVTRQESQIEEMRHRLEQLSNPPGNKTAVITGEEEGAAYKDDTNTSVGGSTNEVENKEQIPKEGEWVKLETNADGRDLRDGSGDKNAGDQGNGEDSSEKLEASQEGEHYKGGVETVQGNGVEVGDVRESSKTDQQLVNGTRDGEISEVKDEVIDSNKAEGNNEGASKARQLEKLENSEDGEERHSANSMDSRIRGGRNHRTRTKGRSRRVVSRSREHDGGASNDVQSENSHNGESSKTRGETADNNMLEGNETETRASDVWHGVPANSQMRNESGEETASEGKEHGIVSNNKSSAIPVDSRGGESSETNSGSTESYQDSNGLGEESGGGGDDENGLEGQEEEAISSSRKTDMPENSRADGDFMIRSENTTRSAMEGSEEKILGSVATGLIEQEGSDAEIAEDGEVADVTHRKGPEDGNLVEEKSNPAKTTEEADGSDIDNKSEHQEVREWKKDEDESENVREF